MRSRGIREWACEAVDATVLAAAIRVDAGFETDVRTVVIVDDGVCGVAVEDSARGHVVSRIPFLVRRQVDFLETIGRVAGGASSMNGPEIVHTVQ